MQNLHITAQSHKKTTRTKTKTSDLKGMCMLLKYVHRSFNLSYMCRCIQLSFLLLCGIVHLSTHATLFHLCVVSTRQVTAENLHPHADPGGRPSLWKNSDVLSHYLVKPPHLWSIVVAVALKNLRRGRMWKVSTKQFHWCRKTWEFSSFKHLMINSLTSFWRQSVINFCLVPKSDRPF